MKVYQPQNASLLTTSITPAGATIFNVSFNCKTNNSQIYVHFDATWGIGGSGYDNWQTNLTITELNSLDPRPPETTIGNKDTRLGGQDNRNCSIALFPISGAFSNTSSYSGQYSIKVNANALDSNDALTLYTNLWSMTITEVQN